MPGGARKRTGTPGRLGRPAGHRDGTAGVRRHRRGDRGAAERPALARRAGSTEREADVLGDARGHAGLRRPNQVGPQHARCGGPASRGTCASGPCCAAAAPCAHRSPPRRLEDLNSAMRRSDGRRSDLGSPGAAGAGGRYLTSGSARPPSPTCDEPRTCSPRTGRNWSRRRPCEPGLVALRLGDLPEALNCFDEAAERFQRLGAAEPDLSIHRCAALIAAGLATDALQEADAAISQLDRIDGRPTKRAELLLTAATCALAAGRARCSSGPGHRGAPALRPAGSALVASTRPAGSGERWC